MMLRDDADYRVYFWLLVIVVGGSKGERDEQLYNNGGQENAHVTAQAKRERSLRH
jgi:hypothetical protein